MPMTYVVHIVAGSLGLISGFVALYVTKGATVHRRAGVAFVCAMLTMSLAGVTIAAVRGVAPDLNIPAGLITACLVSTGLTTVRPLHRRALVLYRPGESDSRAAAHPSAACASSAGGARDHALLAVARPYQTELARHRRSRRTRDMDTAGEGAFNGSVTQIL